MVEWDEDKFLDDFDRKLHERMRKNYPLRILSVAVWGAIGVIWCFSLLIDPPPREVIHPIGFVLLMGFIIIFWLTIGWITVIRPLIPYDWLKNGNR